MPDTEAAENGVSTFSMDYMQLNDVDGERAKSTMVMVNHEDGGIFVYANLGKGIQGDKCWLPRRMAMDIDNCGVKDAKVQIKSDQGPAIVAAQQGTQQSSGSHCYIVG